MYAVEKQYWPTMIEIALAGPIDPRYGLLVELCTGFNKSIGFYEARYLVLGEPFPMNTLADELYSPFVELCVEASVARLPRNIFAGLEQSNLRFDIARRAMIGQWPDSLETCLLKSKLSSWDDGIMRSVYRWAIFRERDRIRSGNFPKRTQGAVNYPQAEQQIYLQRDEFYDALGDAIADKTLRVDPADYQRFAASAAEFLGPLRTYAFGDAIGNGQGCEQLSESQLRHSAQFCRDACHELGRRLMKVESNDLGSQRDYILGVQSRINVGHIGADALLYRSDRISNFERSVLFDAHHDVKIVLPSRPFGEPVGLFRYLVTDGKVSGFTKPDPINIGHALRYAETHSKV